MERPNTLVSMSGITKTYPGVNALKGVDFDLKAGEVHCLVGENGAGKSTLMRVLSGAERPDGGTVEVGDKVHDGLDPILGHDLGIGAIYQETDLVPQLSVAQNLFLGHEPVGRFGLDRKEMDRRAGEVLESMDVRLDPRRPVEELSTASKQLVQVAKALCRRDSRVLIMDEPGAVLSDHELERLFGIVARLKERGMGIVYISHRLNEVLKIGDRVSVMRDGALVATSPARQMTVDGIIRLMVGRPLGEQFGKVPAYGEEVALSVRGLTLEGHFRDVSFDLRRGEVLGLAGLVGAGRTMLLNALFGAARPEAGEVFLEGQRVEFRSPRQAVEHGVGLVPEDRRDEGLVLNRSVEENVALSVLERLSPRLILDPSALARTAEGFVESLRIRTPSTKQRVQNLSGGNQQKVVLAKWLAAGVRVLLLDEPTRGVDVGAKAEIYRLINRLVAEGVSVVMASSELPEVLGMSDRILVMAEGRLTKELVGGETSQEEVMRYAVPDSEQAVEAAQAGVRE